MSMTDWLESREIEKAKSRGHAGIWGFFKYDASSSDEARGLATAALAAGAIIAAIVALLSV